MNEDELNKACAAFLTEQEICCDFDAFVAFARRMQAVGVRQGGDIADEHSCKKDYGMCNCRHSIMLECEAEAGRLEGK